MQRIAPELTSNARALRPDATEAERLLWQHLRKHHPRFTRQLVVDRYILDFACRTLRVGIELDGGHHGERLAEDAARNAYLEARGWSILRFWNNDVIGNLDGVYDVIAAKVARAKTHPRPLPFREG